MGKLHFRTGEIIQNRNILPSFLFLPDKSQVQITDYQFLEIRYPRINLMVQSIFLLILQVHP